MYAISFFLYSELKKIMEVRKWTDQWITADFPHAKKEILEPLLNVLKLYNSYHKLYRQLDILRIEDFLPENKSVQQKIQQQQTNKQTKTIMSTPKGTQLHAWILIEYFWHALWKTRGVSGHKTRFKWVKTVLSECICWTTAPQTN